MKGDVLLLNEQAYLAKDDPYLLKRDTLFTIDGPYSVNEDALSINADHHSGVSIRLLGTMTIALQTRNLSVRV